MKKNKAGHTNTLVACGWAGAVFKVPLSFGQEQWGQRPQEKKTKQVKCDGWTNRRTDGRTKQGVESRNMLSVHYGLEVAKSETKPKN